MHWYGGSIAEAVNLSKQKNAIFVVFVEGDNDLSTEMAATIDDSAVLSRLSDQANFLAIKLKSGSANYLHFAQIYQFVPVPSLFFIGRNGTPLEVVCAGVQPSNLALRIDRILEEHFKDKQPSSSSPGLQATPSSSNIQQTVNFVQTEVNALTQQAAQGQVLEQPPNEPKVEPESASGSPRAKIPKTDSDIKPITPEQVVCDGDVCVRRPRSKPDEPGPSQAPTPSLPDTPVDETQASLVQDTESIGSMEERMERAKELIEARRREKADKEKELEKEKEIERRQSGKGVAELKRWQADQELKQIQEERRREKMENNLARQRILEQIAQDRAERRARDTPRDAPRDLPQASVPAPTSGDGGGRARIQFKLPDGTSHTAHFDADGTLRDVQRYVADNLQLSTSSFALWTAFPRRELTDPEASLRGLQLAPSAALLVLPRRTATVVARPSAVSSLITFFTQLFTTIILEPTQSVLNWLRARLFPPPPTQPRAVRTPSPVPPTGNPSPPGGLRRRGNIHRLPSDRAPDDDNNTWNGNSTQQM